jgi:hypothetical protein
MEQLNCSSFFCVSNPLAAPCGQGATTGHILGRLSFTSPSQARSLDDTFARSCFLSALGDLKWLPKIVSCYRE